MEGLDPNHQPQRKARVIRAAQNPRPSVNNDIAAYDNVAGDEQGDIAFWGSGLEDFNEDVTQYGDISFRPNGPPEWINQSPRDLRHYPTWDKLSYDSKAIILKGTLSALGSFQKACAHLGLASNEVEPFLETHKRKLEEPTRVEKIEQEPIARACVYLKFCYPGDSVLNKVRSRITRWAGIIISWPLRIDRSSFDSKELDIAHNDLLRIPNIKLASLDDLPTNDPLAYLNGRTFVRFEIPMKAPWEAPRIRSVLMPEGAGVIGPRMTLDLLEAGTYWISYPGKDQDYAEDMHNFLIGTRGNQPGNVFMPSSASSPHRHADSASKEQRERLGYIPDVENRTASQQSFVPSSRQDLLRTATHNSLAASGVPYIHPGATAALPHGFQGGVNVGPPQKQKVLEVAKLQGNWGKRVLFQFRLPPKYKVITPSRYVMTFDSGKRTPEDGISGLCDGVGGLYTVVSRINPYIPVSLSRLPKIPEFDDHARLRMLISHNMAIYQNNSPLPGLTETGIHELSAVQTMSGNTLDLVCVNGRYQILNGMQAAKNAEFFWLESPKVVGVAQSQIPSVQQLSSRRASQQRMVTATSFGSGRGNLGPPGRVTRPETLNPVLENRMTLYRDPYQERQRYGASSNASYKPGLGTSARHTAGHRVENTKGNRVSSNTARQYILPQKRTYSHFPYPVDNAMPKVTSLPIRTRIQPQNSDATETQTGTSAQATTAEGHGVQGEVAPRANIPMLPGPANKHHSSHRVVLKPKVKASPSENQDPGRGHDSASRSA